MAKNKLTACKACGGQLAASAKTCPHCGAKNKKPFYKKVWFWLLMVIVILVAAGSGGETETAAPAAATQPPTVEVPAVQTSIPATEASDVEADTTAPSETTAPPETEAPTLPQKEAYQVGDKVQLGNLEIVYAASGVYKSSSKYQQPAKGNQFIFLELAFLNTSKSADASVSVYEFKAYADGYDAPMQYFGDDTLSATLSAGRSTSGRVYFEVPKDAKQIEIEYSVNLFTDEKLVFLYEGEADSGYKLEADGTATEGALKVGEVAESHQLKITYLDCYKDKSGNQFISPKKGYQYVTCEFEFENLTDRDQTVSYFSFDCYADGVSCEGSYFRDDALSATLSAGRKAKGTVTFEVPKDASVVEVEYLSNFWTSNRVVFNAKPDK